MAMDMEEAYATVHLDTLRQTQVIVHMHAVLSVYGPLAVDIVEQKNLLIIGKHERGFGRTYHK